MDIAGIHFFPNNGPGSQHIQLFGMVAEWACGGCHSKGNISSYPTLKWVELLQVASLLLYSSCLVQDAESTKDVLALCGLPP